MTKCISS